MGRHTRVTTLLVPCSWREPIKFNRDFEERKLLFIALVSNCSHRSCQEFQIKTITSSKISQQLRLQGVNKSYVVVVSCCVTDWSVDCVPIVISESTIKDCLQTRNVKVDGHFLCCVWNTFFWLYRRVGFVHLKRYYVSHIMRWRWRFHFRYVTNNILLTL